MDEVDCFFEHLEGIFADENFTKVQVVNAIREFIPNFKHEEKVKNLDQKMYARCYGAQRLGLNDSLKYLYD